MKGHSFLFSVLSLYVSLSNRYNSQFLSVFYVNKVSCNSRTAIYIDFLLCPTKVMIGRSLANINQLQFLKIDCNEKASFFILIITIAIET